MRFMKVSYKTQGTCSSCIEVELDDNNIVKEVKFVGGCDGNTKGITKLVQGMPKDEVINKLKGIKCGNKRTSCPDQLARALESVEE